MLRTACVLALRGMVRRPYFALVSLLGTGFTLATLLLGAALLEHVFAASPPLSRGGRIVGILGQKLSGPESTRTGFAGWALLRHAIGDLEHAEDVAVFRHARRTDVWSGDVRARAALKSNDAGFWRILDFRFLEGGGWGAADDAAGRRVAVISAGLARRLLGSGSVLGAQLEVDGRSFEIVGVVQDVPMTKVLPFAELWVPLSSARSDSWREETGDSLGALLLARSPGERTALQAELAARAAQIVPPEPFETVSLYADTPFEFVSRSVFGPDQAHPERLVALLVLAALAFMALPALNLVTLAMSRGLERAAEIGVRRAFGATRGALVVQLVAETLVVTGVGAILALLLTVVALALVESSGWLPGARLSVGPFTAAATLVLAVVFSLLSGVVPAWRLARLQPVDALAGRNP